MKAMMEANVENVTQLGEEQDESNLEFTDSHIPLLIPIIGGTLVSVGLAIGKQGFHINIPLWSIPASFFAGECISLLPRFRKTFKLYRAGIKEIPVTDDNSIINLFKTTYSTNKKAFNNAYNNQVEQSNNDPVKKLKIK